MAFCYGVYLFAARGGEEKHEQVVLGLFRLMYSNNLTNDDDDKGQEIIPFPMSDSSFAGAFLFRDGYKTTPLASFKQI